MTRALRSAHLIIFTVLAVLLPVLFVSGLAVRKPAPAGVSAAGPTLTGQEFDLRGKNFRLHFFLSADTVQFTPSTYALEPDVLLYWSSAPTNSPENAHLVGRVQIGTSMKLPGAGTLLFYSLGHQKLLASVRVGGSR